MDVGVRLRRAAEQLNESLAREPTPETPTLGRDWRPSLVGVVAVVLVFVSALFLLARVSGVQPTDNPEVSELRPVSLGDPHVWPVVGLARQPSEVAIAFAIEVLGWESPSAWTESQADPSGPVWVRVSQAGGGSVPLDVLTEQASNGGRVLVEVRVAWGTPTSVRSLAPDESGSMIVLVGVGGAETADVTIRLASGQQMVLSVDRSDIARGRLALPEISDSTDVRTVLIRWLDDKKQVIAATSN